MARGPEECAQAHGVSVRGRASDPAGEAGAALDGPRARPLQFPFAIEASTSRSKFSPGAMTSFPATAAVGTSSSVPARHQ